MTEDFGWTRAEFSASRSIGQIVMACTGFIIGTYIDRFGGRPFIVVGALTPSAAIYSLGSINSLSQWLVINDLILTMGAEGVPWLLLVWGYRWQGFACHQRQPGW